MEKNWNLSPQSSEMLALVALIIIAIFRSRIVESIILGSAVMDEFKFVNPSAPPACVKAFFFTTCLPRPNSISTTHFATKLGRQGCRRKTKARHPNDHVDHNDFNHNNTSGNSLHDIQKMSICNPPYQGYASPCIHSARYSEAPCTWIFL